MVSSRKSLASERNDFSIVVKKRQITSGIYIPHQIDFEITDRALSYLKESQNQFKKLKLSPDLLTELRYYSLLQSPYSSESRLIFTTYYVKQQQKIAVIKTSISLRGKISQQIARSYLQDILLLDELLNCHYWLISQISDRLSLKDRNRSSLLVWGLSLIITSFIAPFIFFLINLSWLFKLIILIIFFLLLYKLLKIIIQLYLPSSILQQLLFGFLAKNTQRRRLGFAILKYFK